MHEELSVQSRVLSSILDVLKYPRHAEKVGMVLDTWEIDKV